MMQKSFGSKKEATDAGFEPAIPCTGNRCLTIRPAGQLMGYLSCLCDESGECHFMVALSIKLILKGPELEDFRHTILSRLVLTCSHDWASLGRSVLFAFLSFYIPPRFRLFLLIHSLPTRMLSQYTVCSFVLVFFYPRPAWVLIISLTI